MKVLKTVLLLVAVFVATAFVSNHPTGYEVGDEVVDFKLKNIDGKLMSLSALEKAEGVIVVFTCNTCPFSIAYEDRIVALDKKYKNVGYPVVAINPNDVVKKPGDSFENMKKRAEEKGFTFPYLYDETQEVAKQFGATRTPHVYILKKEDKSLKVAYIGAIDNNSRDAEKVTERYVENALNDLLSGKSPSLNNTKAIGCSIKWKN